MSFHTCRMYILPDTLNLDTLLVDLDQPKIRPKRPERPSGTAPVPLPFAYASPMCFAGLSMALKSILECMRDARQAEVSCPAPFPQCNALL